MDIQEALDKIIEAVDTFNSMLEVFEPESGADLLLIEASVLIASNESTETNQSKYLWEKVSKSVLHITSVLKLALPAFSTAASANQSHYHFNDIDRKEEFDLSLQRLDANARLVTNEYDLALTRLNRVPDSDNKQRLTQALKETYNYLCVVYSTINKGISVINQGDPTVKFDHIAEPAKRPL